MIFDAGTEHIYPSGFATVKKVKENKKGSLYSQWEDSFKRSYTELNEKLLKDIKMFNAIIAYIQTYDVRMDVMKENIKSNNDFDEIKDLICLVNVTCMEYAFTLTANFTNNNNNSIKKYHREIYSNNFYSYDYFQHYILNHFPSNNLKNHIMGKLEVFESIIVIFH